MRISAKGEMRGGIQGSPLRHESKRQRKRLHQIAAASLGELGIDANASLSAVMLTRICEAILPYY